MREKALLDRVVTYILIHEDLSIKGVATGPHFMSQFNMKGPKFQQAVNYLLQNQDIFGIPLEKLDRKHIIALVDQIHIAGSDFALEDKEYIENELNSKSGDNCPILNLPDDFITQLRSVYVFKIGASILMQQLLNGKPENPQLQTNLQDVQHYIRQGMGALDIVNEVKGKKSEVAQGPAAGSAASVSQSSSFWNVTSRIAEKGQKLRDMGHDWKEKVKGLLNSNGAPVVANTQTSTSEPTSAPVVDEGYKIKFQFRELKPITPEEALVYQKAANHSLAYIKSNLNETLLSDLSKQLADCHRTIDILLSGEDLNDRLLNMDAMISLIEHCSSNASSELKQNIKFVSLINGYRDAYNQEYSRLLAYQPPSI